MKKGKLINAGLIAILGLGLFSCGCNDKEPTFREQLTAYWKKDLPIVTVSSDKYAAYFDFSGVYVAYEDSDTKATFNGLTQKITSNGNFNIYKLANSEITELTGELNPAQQFQQIHSVKEQNQLYAPIEETFLNSATL